MRGFRSCLLETLDLQPQILSVLRCGDTCERAGMPVFSGLGGAQETLVQTHQFEARLVRGN